ncbi:MAG: FABP family protein [Actinomycetota bacterium]|nr:FABP family protein [Actinomycetota bacterium]
MTGAEATSLHPALARLAALVGSWVGAGHGDYPTNQAFDYLEHAELHHTGRPWLAYTQRSTDPNGRPLHSETGYLRPQGTGSAELVVVQPTGVTEVDEGELDSAGARS